MKASRFMGNMTFEVADLPMPKAGPGELVVHNKVCGVCGTDVHIYHGEPGSADVNPPVVLGHEYSGEVMEVGQGVTGFAVGTTLPSTQHLLRPLPVLPERQKAALRDHGAIGVTRDGGFAEYSLIPASQAFKLDPSVPFEAAAMAEPLACCLHGIDLAGIQAGDKVCVVGGGAIGLIMVQLAKLSGASKIVVSEPNEKRCQVALEVGAGAAIDPTSPAMRSFHPGHGWFRRCGHRVRGQHPRGEERLPVRGQGGHHPVVQRAQGGRHLRAAPLRRVQEGADHQGSFVNPDTHDRAVRLINSGKVDFSSIITHRFTLDQLPEAIAMQMSSESIKVVVEAK